MDPLSLKAGTTGVGGLLDAGPASSKKTCMSPFDEVRQKLGVPDSPTMRPGALEPQYRTIEATSSGSLVSKVSNRLDVTGVSLQQLGQRVRAVPQTTELGSLRTRVEQLAVRFTNIGNSFHQIGVQPDPQKLLAMQQNIYQISEDVELLSKLVDQATSGVKTILQTQV